MKGEDGEQLGKKNLREKEEDFWGKRALENFGQQLGAAGRYFGGRTRKGKEKEKRENQQRGIGFSEKEGNGLRTRLGVFFLEKSRRRKGAPSGMDYYF